MRFFSINIFLISLFVIPNSGYPLVRLRPKTIPISQAVIFNRADYYKALQENNKALVAAQLEILKSAPEKIRTAFTGAMLMKRADFGGSGANKLHYFKEGHKMLETAIQSDPENVEYRFLRLVIQEHAPSFLGYKNDILKDSEYIRKSYKSLPDDVQALIVDYSKKSKNLKLDVS